MISIFDRYARKYDAWYDKNRFVYLSELEALRKSLPKKGKGLEIGVGTGRFAGPLGAGIGIDPAKRMIEIAKRRGVDAHLGCGEHLAFKNEAFDYVTIILTLCFVKEPLKVLKESWRVLKKDGKIIVGMVDKESFLGKFYQRKRSIFYKQATFFSVEEASRLIKNAGFGKLSYYQTLSKMPNEITTIEKPKGGFGKGGFVVISARKL